MEVDVTKAIYQNIVNGFVELIKTGKKDPNIEKSFRDILISIIGSENITITEDFRTLVVKVSKDGENTSTQEISNGIIFPVSIHKLISSNGSKEEITVAAYNHQAKKMKFVRISSDLLSSSNIFSKVFGTFVHIRSSTPGSKRIVEDSIRRMIPEVNDIRDEFVEIGWANSSNGENIYVMGEKIIPAKENNSAHESLLPFKFAYEKNMPFRDIVKWLQEVFFNLGPGIYVKTAISFMLLALTSSLMQKLSEKPAFALGIRATTGSFKTSSSLVAFELIEPYDKSPMLNFTATLAGILKIADFKKDCIIFVDDYFPSKDKQQVKTMHKLFSLLSRIFCDNTHRATANRSKKAECICGLFAYTCEEMPSPMVPSEANRHFLITLKPGDISQKILTRIQNEKPVYNAFFKAQIEKIASDPTSWVKTIFKCFKDTQADLRQSLPELHGRLISAGAWLYSSFSVITASIAEDVPENAEIFFQARSTYLNELKSHLIELHAEYSDTDPFTAACIAISNAIKGGKHLIYPVESRGKEHFSQYSRLSINNHQRDTEDFLGFDLGGYYYLSANKCFEAFKTFCETKDVCFTQTSERKFLTTLYQNKLIYKDGKSFKTRFSCDKNQFQLLKIEKLKLAKFLNVEEIND